MLLYNMSKVFKKIYPYTKFIEFIDSIAIKNKNSYFLDINLYKKAVYNKKIQPFINDLEEYYRESKKMYIHKKITYKALITILRQICKSHDIEYDSNMKYINNTYHIEYIFHIDTSNPYDYL